MELWPTNHLSRSACVRGTVVRQPLYVILASLELTHHVGQVGLEITGLPASISEIKGVCHLQSVLGGSVLLFYDSKKKSKQGRTLIKQI